MATKAELEAEIEKLKAQLAEQQPEVQGGIEIGGEYYTSMGLAKVVKFYKEDGHNKVQCLMQSVDPADGLTLTGSEALCSMPIELFKARMADHKADQRQREQLRKKGVK